MARILHLYYSVYFSKLVNYVLK